MKISAMNIYIVKMLITSKLIYKLYQSNTVSNMRYNSLS